MQRGHCALLLIYTFRALLDLCSPPQQWLFAPLWRHVLLTLQVSPGFTHVGKSLRSLEMSAVAVRPARASVPVGCVANIKMYDLHAKHLGHGCTYQGDSTAAAAAETLWMTGMTKLALIPVIDSQQCS